MLELGEPLTVLAQGGEQAEPVARIEGSTGSGRQWSGKKTKQVRAVRWWVVDVTRLYWTYVSVQSVLEGQYGNGRELWASSIGSVGEWSDKITH